MSKSIKPLKAHIDKCLAGPKMQNMTFEERYEAVNAYIDKLRVNKKISYSWYERLDRWYRKRLGMDDLHKDYSWEYEDNIPGYIKEVQIPILEDMLCTITEESITSQGGNYTIKIKDLYDCKTTMEVEQKLKNIKRDFKEIV